MQSCERPRGRRRDEINTDFGKRSNAANYAWSMAMAKQQFGSSENSAETKT